MSVWSWLLHVLGVEPRTPSTTYNFWSGFGSDLAEFTMIGAVWHALNCHEDRCWRIGHRVTAEASGAYVRRCRKHHTIRHDTKG